MKKYNPKSKNTDAEWLRNVILVGATPEAQVRFYAIADRLEAIDALDDSSPKPDTEIDFVGWRRFVGMLRESADTIHDEIIADAGHERGNDHPALALVCPRLREAATRIEKVAEIAEQVARTVPPTMPSLFAKVLLILNGRE